MSYFYDYQSIPQGATCRGYTLSGEYWIDASGFKMDRKALYPDLETLERLEIPAELTTNEEVKEWMISLAPSHKKKEYRKALDSDLIPIPDIEGEWIEKLHVSEEVKERMLRDYLEEIGRKPQIKDHDEPEESKEDN